MPEVTEGQHHQGDQDFKFPQQFLEDEQRLGKEMEYDSDVRRAIADGDIQAAKAYLDRAHEKGSHVDVKDTLRGELMHIISTEGRLHQNNTPDSLPHFAQELGTEFVINNELQPMVETQWLGGHLTPYTGALEPRGQKPKRDIDRIAEFARARGVELNYQTPRFQMNLQRCQDVHVQVIADTLLGKYGSSTEGRHRDAEIYMQKALPDMDKLAEEQGFRLDWRTSVQKSLHKLSKEPDSQARRHAAETVVDQAHQRGYGLDASFDRIHHKMTHSL
jgi:hypothetical protein